MRLVMKTHPAMFCACLHDALSLLSGKSEYNCKRDFTALLNLNALINMEEPAFKLVSLVYFQSLLVSCCILGTFIEFLIRWKYVVCMMVSVLFSYLVTSIWFCDFVHRKQ